MSTAAEAMNAMNTAQAALSTPPAVGAATQAASQTWSPDLIRFLSTSVLMFTFGALVLASVLLLRTRAPASQILRVFGVISIIGISALLLVVGYSNDQLTPIVGLFGAIAGYLLGKDSGATPPAHPDHDTSAHP